MKNTLILLSILFLIINGCKQESFPQNMEVLTRDAEDIQLYSAVVFGNITYGNTEIKIISRGILWGDSPSLSFNSKVEYLGAGFGTFSTMLDSLEDNKKHYARAFAISQNDTFYGNQISFITKEDILKSAPCHPKKNELQFNSFNTRYYKVEVNYSSIFEIKGINYDTDISFKFSEEPLTGKYITVASTKELGSKKCSVSFYEIRKNFHANVGDTIYVLNDGRGMLSVVFCGIKFSAKNNSTIYISDCYLATKK